MAKLRDSAGAIAIGRNEGERLKRCLASLLDCDTVVYVDSGSTDDSVSWARSTNIEVVDLDLRMPFTAARARNAGLTRLVERVPTIKFVQFVDGDCEVATGWIVDAIDFLEHNPNVAVVFGNRRERSPTSSVYNWLCDREWQGPPGESLACGGDAMMRVKAIQSVGGYRNDMIAGEEPELCVRLRAQGWKIWRIDREMTRHDAAIFGFTHWWTRTVRSGYAFALGAHLHGTSRERFWVWESRRALIFGLLIPLFAALVSAAFFPWGVAIWLVYPALVARQILRNRGSFKDRVTLSLFQILSRFPEGVGQIRFFRDRLLNKQSRLIEYK